MEHRSSKPSSRRRHTEPRGSQPDPVPRGPWNSSRHRPEPVPSRQSSGVGHAKRGLTPQGGRKAVSSTKNCQLWFCNRHPKARVTSLTGAWATTTGGSAEEEKGDFTGSAKSPERKTRRRNDSRGSFRALGPRSTGRPGQRSGAHRRPSPRDQEQEAACPRCPPPTLGVAQLP